MAGKIGFVIVNMDAAEQARRWANSKQKLRAAQLCFDGGLYGDSLTRSYYACYQAMWSAAGDPVLGLWRHGGLINEFCRGRWTVPVLLPTALAALRKKLEALYRLRTLVDYEAASPTVTEAQFGLETANELLRIMAHHTGWAL